MSLELSARSLNLSTLILLTRTVVIETAKETVKQGIVIVDEKLEQFVQQLKNRGD